MKFFVESNVDSKERKRKNLDQKIAEKNHIEGFFHEHFKR